MEHAVELAFNKALDELLVGQVVTADWAWKRSMEFPHLGGDLLKTIIAVVRKLTRRYRRP